MPTSVPRRILLSHAVNDSRRHFMSKDARIRNQRIESTKRIQIAPAEPHHPDFQQYLSFRDNGFGTVSMDACPGFWSTSAFIGCTCFPLSKLFSQRVLFHPSDMDFGVPIIIKPHTKRVSVFRGSEVGKTTRSPSGPWLNCTLSRCPPGTPIARVCHPASTRGNESPPRR